ncbi:hypothetical protein LguiB_018032 [Lonicera macranthoides]
MERLAARVFLSIPSVDVPSAPSICANDDGEASLRGVVLVFLSKPSVHIPFAPSVYANDDGEAVRVFLSIPSVDVPSAPSVYANDDGEAVRVFLSTPSVHISFAPSVYVNGDSEASLRGAVMIYIKDGLRIMVLKGLVRVQPGCFGILRRWYNDVGKGHRNLVLGQGEWSHALLASVNPQVHGLVTTLVPRLIGSCLSTDDKFALLAIKSNIIDRLGILSNTWSTTSNASICTWIGVSCDLNNQSVTALNLSGKGLAGTVALVIGNLSFLTSLDISYNNVTGYVPEELSQLLDLQQLLLFNNSFIAYLIDNNMSLVQTRFADILSNATLS